MGMFTLIGKTKVKLVNVNVLAEKQGQKDILPALTLTFEAMLPNDVLNQFDASLKPFLFRKLASPAKGQTALEGVAPISDLPELTDAAQRIGDFTWEYEQTGCKLKLYQGATGSANITLKNGKVDKVKFGPREGGPVLTRFNFYASDLDAETIGDIAVLHQHEMDIELIGPKVDQQALPASGTAVTPIKALEKAEGESKGSEAAWPFPTEAKTKAANKGSAKDAA